ncbi:MAG TPA: LEPR-XLL domain-containing protein [Kiritimatiellia bacterium]|nr:LEPR-XLL domain-containing protein [Kiritimatiellia bacterium]
MSKKQSEPRLLLAANPIPEAEAATVAMWATNTRNGSLP